MGALALCIAIAAALMRVRSLQAQVRRLEAETLTDPLTGAFNRRYMSRALATAVERRNRTGERSSLLLLDVDRFKTINDVAGHTAGDEVLKRLAVLVGRRLRRIDVLCRVGGEEFAVLVARAGFVDALELAEQLRTLVAGAPLAEGRDVSISVGVAELQPGQSAAEWFDDADAALYAAKRSGRNCVAGKDRGGPPVRYEHVERRVKVTVVV